MKKRFPKTSWIIPLLFTFNCVSAQNKNVLPDWAFGGFARPESINPIISPDSSSEFYDPMSQKLIHWESNDTFNPAAAVKDGKVVVLYRSEDKTGIEIGMRTSRLGYAESTDGLHFTRKTKPVLYPANDSQKVYEWPGGCEDPRAPVWPNRSRRRLARRAEAGRKLRWQMLCW